MKVKCYSVKLESLLSISDKAYIARSFDGSEDVIPKSQVFGEDLDSTKSTAYYISAWILEEKNIQYSSKKERYFCSKTMKMLPTYSIKKHVPKEVKKDTNIDESLIR